MIALRSDLWHAQEAERAEPVVDGDNNDVAAHAQRSAIVERLIARAVGEAAAVNPEHHRAALVVGCGREDIEVEAVFTLRTARRKARDRMRRLRRREPDGVGVAHTAPAIERLRSAEALRLGVGDAEKRHMFFARDARDPSAGRGDGVKRSCLGHGRISL